MASSPLGALEIETVLSAQERHELWAEKGQFPRAASCRGLHVSG